MESPDSSSPAITRTVAAALRGQYGDVYEFTPWQRQLLRLVGRFPQGVARALITRYQSLSGLPPERLRGLSIETLARNRLQDYAGLPGPFPAVLIGAPLGGSAAHLALALGAPFLPQAFVTTLRGGAPDGDVQAYFRRSVGLARELARANPGIMTIQHFDPVHDGWITRYANHLRFKLLDLPEAYTSFLRRTLQPGGAIVFLECGARWLRYRIDERSVFQVGGWGGISAQEFLEGSQRIREYVQRVGLKHSDWRLTGFPLEEGPESEWGVEPGLGENLERFCIREGYRFVRLRLPEPHDYSRLVFHAVRRQIEKNGQQPGGVVVETFGQYDPTSILRGGLLPLWLVFNTHDSLQFLKSMRPEFPKEKPVFFSPLSTFTITPDIVPWSDWETALRGLSWTPIGARQSHYPSDTLALTDWSVPLRRWVEAHLQPVKGILTAEEVLELAKSERQAT